MIRSCCLVLLAVFSAVAIAAEPKRAGLVGTWKIVVFQDDGGDQIKRLGQPLPDKFPKVVFTEKDCWIIRPDGSHMTVSGQANCAFKSYTLDERDPARIRFVSHESHQGRMEPHEYVGLWKIDQGKLHICYNEGTVANKLNGSKLPTQFVSDGEFNLFVCEKISDTPEEIKKKK